MATDLKITQVRSAIGKPEALRKVLRGMGLRKVHHSVILPDTAEVRGMIYKVPHLVQVERVAAGQRKSARKARRRPDAGERAQA